MVVYADRFVPDGEKNRARENGEKAQAIPFLKRFTVFNTAQCEGLLPIGVILFPGTGIQDNLADKAKRLGIPVFDFRAKRGGA